MKCVEPIRDKKDRGYESNVGRWKFSDRNALLFILEINTACRISDLRTLQLKDVLEISRNKVVVRERMEMVNHHFDCYLFPSIVGHDPPMDRDQHWRILSETAKRVG